MLIAAVMGLGMNHGLGRLARSTPFSYRQLAWAADWHIREDTLRAALIELDQFVLHHPLARYWGTGIRSSSDGMRVRVGVNAANADRNAAYFGPGRGVTIYGHMADFRLPYHTQVISTNDREALYVIDGLCNHETAFRVFPRYRRPSVGELVGTTQYKRRVSRQYHLRRMRDPMSPVKNYRRRCLRKVGYYSSLLMFLRAVLCAGRRRRADD